MNRSLRRLTITAALLLAVSGCTNPFAPRIADILGESSPPPSPTSPQGVVRLFEWCWNNRALSEYKEIFTDDFRFQFANGDTAGSIFREGFLDREAEIEIAQNLFESGSATRPAANSIDLSLDPTLVDLDDPRVGKNPKWHRTINTNVRLTIVTDDENLNVQGSVIFYTVRGDSALIPPELQSRFRPDSTRWWIERWEDFTLDDTSLPQARAGRTGPGKLRTAEDVEAFVGRQLAQASRSGRLASPASSQVYVTATLGQVKAAWYDGPGHFAALPVRR